MAVGGFMDRFRTNPYSNMRARAAAGIVDLTGAGAPTNGTSGTGVNISGPGSTYFDITNKNLYINIGSISSPFWQSTLFGANGLALTLRRHNTIAEVNAGVTLLAAIPGWKPRLQDAAMISVGGAVGAATTVDILATQATASVKLMAAAIAALTQSALLRIGATNAVILADGASFAVNDVNTAITLGKTGATATTATHVDTLITVALEQ